MNEYDATAQFFNWWCQNKPQKPPQGQIINDDGMVTEVILYRDDCYQVQQCIVSSNAELPDHIHPEVDSFELYMSGDITFRRDGHFFIPQRPGLDNLRILPSSSHGGTFGPRGGTFLSIQRWLDGVEPDFISRNWEFSDPNETERNKCMD